MDQRGAYIMLCGKEVDLWGSEHIDIRARRCVAFLLLLGVITDVQADRFEQRILDNSELSDAEKGEA